MITPIHIVIFTIYWKCSIVNRSSLFPTNDKIEFPPAYIGSITSPLAISTSSNYEFLEILTEFELTRIYAYKGSSRSRARRVNQSSSKKRRIKSRVLAPEPFLCPRPIVNQGTRRVEDLLISRKGKKGRFLPLYLPPTLLLFFI